MSGLTVFGLGYPNVADQGTRHKMTEGAEAVINTAAEVATFGAAPHIEISDHNRDFRHNWSYLKALIEHNPNQHNVRQIVEALKDDKEPLAARRAVMYQLIDELPNIPNQPRLLYSLITAPGFFQVLDQLDLSIDKLVFMNFEPGVGMGKFTNVLRIEPSATTDESVHRQMSVTIDDGVNPPQSFLMDSTDSLPEALSAHGWKDESAFDNPYMNVYLTLGSDTRSEVMNSQAAREILERVAPTFFERNPDVQVTGDTQIVVTLRDQTVELESQSVTTVPKTYGVNKSHIDFDLTLQFADGQLASPYTLRLYYDYHHPGQGTAVVYDATGPIAEQSISQVDWSVLYGETQAALQTGLSIYNGVPTALKR